MKTSIFLKKVGLLFSLCFSLFCYSNPLILEDFVSINSEDMLTIPSTIDFDGIDDYISRNALLGGFSNTTMMTWVKLDSSFDGGDVIGQPNLRLYIDSNKNLKTFIKTDGNDGVNSLHTPLSSAPTLITNRWYHIAVMYDGARGEINMYLNGELVWNFIGLSGTSLNNLPAFNSDHEFEIGRNSENENNYFEGAIYECRVYNVSLTNAQLGRQVFQEIENNQGNIRGIIIPKDIEALKWSDLELYYKMDLVNAGFTTDYSDNSIDGQLFNMTTSQERTAPMPYITKSGGNNKWSNKNNWLFGDVWDITSNPSSCAIVRITENLTTSVDHKTVGLIIDSGAKLEVSGDSGLWNNWFLKLDGEIDLQGESQLIQTDGSDLAVTSSGTIERDQQGTADVHTYNYWSSPVGVSNITSNNNSYTLPDVMRDGSQNINFLTSGYDGANTNPVSIADYWIWKFANQLDDDYSSWQHVRSTGTIHAGEGFTMKGPGSGTISDDQNYVFTGKPNNGDINLTINAGNDYLVGNPYPSAIDAHQFILDNAPVIEGSGAITGALYFWEHWGGGSHNLAEYLGGYATYNLSGGTPSASKGSNDPDVGTGGTPTKTPGRYIPVSQGFFVIGETNGSVNFNNGQRVFQREAANSVFMEANSSGDQTFVSGRSSNEAGDEVADPRMKVRIGLNSINEIHRQLLVTVDENATSGIDWGYDAVLYEDQVDDLYWMLEGERYTIQGTNTIDIETILPLGIHTDDDGMNTIMIDKLENVEDSIEIYLHDKELDIHHDLKSGAYEIYLIAGTYLERFEITFSNQDALGTGENTLNVFDTHYSNDIESIVITNPTNKEMDAVELINILGQSVFSTQDVEQKDYIAYKVSGLSTGTYIIKIKTPQGTISKKVLVK